nr:MAG TPA: hypothetical protein [Caudoviricetes sp.]
MGTWSTTAPTNLATEWTEIKENNAQGGYRLKISGNYVYLYYNCIARACSAWLETGQLCVKVENYSFATGNASPGNSLSTNAYVTDESGVKVYADANTTNMGDSSETAHGHSRGTYYYTYDASFTVTSAVEAGIRDNSGVYGNGTCGVTVVVDTKPGSGGSSGGGGSGETTANPVQNLYLKINGVWHPILWG